MENVNIWIGKIVRDHNSPRLPVTPLSKYPYFDVFIVPTKNIFAEGKDKDIAKTFYARALTSYNGKTYYETYQKPESAYPMDFKEYIKNSMGFDDIIRELIYSIAANIKQTHHQ